MKKFSVLLLLFIPFLVSCSALDSFFGICPDKQPPVVVYILTRNPDHTGTKFIFYFAPATCAAKEQLHKVLANKLRECRKKYPFSNNGYICTHEPIDYSTTVIEEPETPDEDYFHDNK